jgi:bisphosphoglycerate-independent phosphoglycerate mutase (AlkP superfamily)
LGKYAGKAQLRIAETEKYPHVTYFFNGGVEVGLGIPKAMTGRSLLERRARV